MEEILIRPAVPEDTPALRAAVIDLQEHEACMHATRLPGAQIADDYLEWLKRRIGSHGAVLIAEHENAFTGFIAYWVAENDNPAEAPDSNRCGYISDLYVVPAFRGRQIARMLLATAEQHLVKADIHRLRIGALAANELAQKCYERAGFTAYETIYEKQIRMPLSREIGGAKGPDPTRYGDWEHKGRCTDF